MIQKVPIKRVTASAFRIPVETGMEADGTLQWGATGVVVVEILAGDQLGIGYTYAHPAARAVIHESLEKVLVGGDALDIPAAHRALIQQVRNIGRPGIASHAIAALDIALWDLKAKILGLSISKLLGQSRSSIPIYGSGGFTSYTAAQLQKQLSNWVEKGISRVKMKIGGTLQETVERVRVARQAIGVEPELFVDANGAFDPRQAISVSERLSEYDVSWFEEPVSSDDLEGMAFVRGRVAQPLEIASGEYGYDPQYFDRMIGAQAVDVVQIDATRCQGITGFLAAAAICRSRHKPISAHTAPQIHSHLCCVVPGARHVEYFYDHVRIESLLFDGALKPENGCLVPDTASPGLGIELRRRDLSRFAA